MDETIEVDLADLLRSWSNEVVKMAAMAESLQTILAIACARANGDNTFRRDAQACDLLTQTLDAMSRFMSSLADLVPTGCVIDITQATRAIPLAELAAAIAPKVMHREGGVPGVVCFFDSTPSAPMLRSAPSPSAIG